MVEQLYSVAEGDVIILTDIWLLVVTIVIKNQTLLQAAWAGDAMTVKKCLVGTN